MRQWRKDKTRREHEAVCLHEATSFDAVLHLPSLCFHLRQSCEAHNVHIESCSWSVAIAAVDAHVTWVAMNALHIDVQRVGGYCAIIWRSRFVDTSFTSLLTTNCNDIQPFLLFDRSDRENITSRLSACAASCGWFAGTARPLQNVGTHAKIVSAPSQLKCSVLVPRIPQVPPIVKQLHTLKEKWRLCSQSWNERWSKSEDVLKELRQWISFLHWRCAQISRMF